MANGKYDAEYRKFFKIAKASGAKFLYRTMHEMNGSWYSWSGDPTNFKKAWIHIYELSREEGLDTQSILFIMSVNSQDLPTVDGSIGGKMISCSPINKKKTGCRSFEDYYPGNAYVDMMGMTLYNWGRGRGEEWAKWRSFPELLNDKNTKMLLRISSYGKPVFLDEVGTTAVNFKGSWSLAQAQQTYANDTTTKNEWISGFKSELFLHPQIVGAMYFNRDKTDGLSNPIVGELDWSVLSLRLDKEYSSVLDFWSDPRIDASVLPFKYDYPVVNGKKTGEKLAKKILNDTKNDAIKRQLKTKEELAKISLKIKNTKSKTMKRYWETVFSTMEVNLGK